MAMFFEGSWWDWEKREREVYKSDENRVDKYHNAHIGVSICNCILHTVCRNQPCQVFSLPCQVFSLILLTYKLLWTSEKFNNAICKIKVGSNCNSIDFPTRMEKLACKGLK